MNTQTNGKPINVSDAEFEQIVLRSDLPVLVDFWAEWCGPCRIIAPTVADLAEDYDGRLKVVKVNVDQNPAISQVFGIRLSLIHI